MGRLEQGNSVIDGGDCEGFNLDVITGPTAVGKTDYALSLAERLGAEILSCDSLLVYRGMDIGTAKPGAEEQARIRHHGLDLVSPGRIYSIDAYVRYALGVVADCQRRGVPLVVVGGSGFYLRAFFGPVVDHHPVPVSVRAAVDDQLQTDGLAAVVHKLQALNPDGTGDLDLANPRRVVNALARCLASGKTVIELRREFAALPSPFAAYRPRLTLLERDPRDLARRIDRRTAAMLRDGLVAEVRRLLAMGLRDNRSARTAIGYREVIEWLDSRGGDDQLPAVEAAICANTRRLVKKQRNWFSRHLPVNKVFRLEAN